MHGEKIMTSGNGGGGGGGSAATAIINTTPTNLSAAAAAAANNNGLMGGILNVKDSRWLQLEVCREFQRGQCSRSDLECKFAHPPPHVEIQNGRVTACYDSIKGRCTRENPKCKYLHPPQHLKDQLLINGRNNLVLKNLLANQMTAQIAAPLSISPLTAMPGTSALIPNIAASYNPYATYTLNAAALYPGLIPTSNDPFGMFNGLMPAQNSMAAIAAMQKMVSNNNSSRIERVEALNSPVNKRAALEKGGVPVMQPIYQAMPGLGAMPYQSFTVPGLTASYFVPASIAGNPTTLARF